MLEELDQQWTIGGVATEVGRRRQIIKKDQEDYGTVVPVYSTFLSVEYLDIIRDQAIAAIT